MAPNRRHKCTECPMSFPNASGFKRHVAHAHSDECPHVCDVCKKGFKSVRNVRQHHEIAHSPAKDYECNECHTFFTRASDVRRHKLAKHATTGGTTPHDDPVERPHVCAVCGRGFEYARNLRDHAKIHEPERKFQCPTCRKFLSRERDFTRHQRTCLRAQSANSGPDAQDASLGEDVGDDVEEARGDQDAAFGEDFKMLEDDDALSSSGSDSSNVFVSVDDSFHLRHRNGNTMHYRSRSDSDDDDDDADAQSNDEQALKLFVPFAPRAAIPQKRPDPDADFAAFSVNMTATLVHRARERVPTTRSVSRGPVPTADASPVDAPAYAEGRVCVSLASRLDESLDGLSSIRNLSSTFDTLRHIANLVVEPVARGRRFGSRDHPEWSAPTKSSVVLWHELGRERAAGAYRTFQTVPKALEFVAQEGLLQTSYVENLAFRQNGVGDVTNYIWQHLAKSRTSAEIGQWTIDGLRLEAVARFGNVRGPLDAVKRLRSLTVRNSPYMPTQ